MFGIVTPFDGISETFYDIVSVSEGIVMQFYYILRLWDGIVRVVSDIVASSEGISLSTDGVYCFYFFYFFCCLYFYCSCLSLKKEGFRFVQSASGFVSFSDVVAMQVYRILQLVYHSLLLADDILESIHLIYHPYPLIAPFFKGWGLTDEAA